MRSKRQSRPDPVVIHMRISQVRSLIERLSNVHGSPPSPHIGWASCNCDLAKILRECSGAIHNHLGLLPLQDTPYQTGAEE